LPRLKGCIYEGPSKKKVLIKLGPFKKKECDLKRADWHLCYNFGEEINWLDRELYNQNNSNQRGLKKYDTRQPYKKW